MSTFKPLLSTFKPQLFAILGFFAALGVLSLAHSGPAQAQSPGVNLTAILARLNADEAKIAADDAKITALTTQQTADEANIAADATKITALQAKTAPLSVSGTDLTITGVNVHIVDGTGHTASSSGLGNLTIGYNRTGRYPSDVRTGSHNLILGDQNNYSSYGGLVAGQQNTISGPYASVSGGYFNTASGYIASVSGGADNTASGYFSSVSGGNSNTASGDYSSVSGGYFNTASGDYSSVSGGYFNNASGFLSSVSGGESVTQSNNYGWSGGSYHTP